MITSNLSRTRRGGPIAASTTYQDLPAWPLLLLLHGFPLFWLLGLVPFAAPGLAAVMIAYLLLHRSVHVVPGLWPFLAFLSWVGASAIMLTDLSQTIGFVQRFAELVAVGVAMLYYVNCRKLAPRHIINGFMTIWLTVVLLGVAAIFLPDLRLTTPTGLLLPHSIVSNELVNELVNPRLAEVQQPWGAAEPFNRPAAPFPYTNNWGMAFVLLTPIAALTAWRTPSRRVRAAVLLGILLSLWPAAETSNRGMFLGLAAYVVILALRWLVRGRLTPALVVVTCVVAFSATLMKMGVVAAILARQEVSNTTDGRGSIYRATFDKALDSPLLGWATPRVDPTIGVSLGTQGYVWMLIYCYGFVGAALFVIFIAGTIARTARVAGDPALVLHSLLPTVLLTIGFYGLGVAQMTVVGLVAAILLRARHYEEAI